MYLRIGIVLRWAINVAHGAFLVTFQCSQTDRWTTGNQKSSPVLQLRWAKIDYGNTWSLHVCFTLVRILVFSLSIWLNILSILCCQLSNRKSSTIIRCYQLPVYLCWIGHSLSHLSSAWVRSSSKSLWCSSTSNKNKKYKSDNNNRKIHYFRVDHIKLCSCAVKSQGPLFSKTYTYTNWNLHIHKLKLTHTYCTHLQKVKTSWNWGQVLTPNSMKNWIKCW